MGGSSSVLNCTSKKKDKLGKVNRPESQREPSKPAPNKSLQNDIEAYEPKIDSLRSQGSEVTRRINPLDKELVEDQIKKREKKFSDVKARSGKAQKGFEILELDLEEIQGKVDQYVAWLRKKEEQVQLTRPQGYQVPAAEDNMHYINGLCSELENRQFTLDTVNKKVEAVLTDLTPKDREEMELSIKALSTEHNRVYSIAVEQKNMLTEALNDREVFQVGLDRVNLWLDNREMKISKLDKHKLTSIDVEKQVEKAKGLMLEIEKYEPNIEQVETRVQALQLDCNPDQSAGLNENLTDAQKKFSDLQDHMKDVHEKLQTGLAARKVLEGDLQKIERWCKEADMKCAVEMSLDCAIEILQEQYKQYKTLDTSARMFESLLQEVEDRSQNVHPFLSEADEMSLQQTTKTAHDKFDILSKTIKDRVKSLDEALQTRDQIGDGILEANDWLTGIQDDLRKITRAIGPTVDDAEDVLKQYENVAEKMANYEPTIAQLNQAVERLRNLGQHTEAEEILRIISQYEMLGDQVRQQTKKCQQAVLSRQQLEDKMKGIDELVKECEDSTDSVIGLQVPVPEKIKKLKAVSAKLQSASPSLFAMGDRAQQIGIEGTSSDAQAVSDMIDDIKARVDDLKKIADRKTKQCESIQRNREDFEDFVDETMNWLDAKEEMLASCSSLDLDPQKVKSSLQKHQNLKQEFASRISHVQMRAKTLARDALDKLDTMKMKAEVEQTHYHNMEEPIPDQLTEKLQQIDNLEDSIKGAISKKEQYLAEATADRMQLEVSMKQINDWIQGAEDLLDSGYDGLDYDTLNDTISEHKDYFSEASMCQDEVEQVMELSERLLPTLDLNDTETLRQSLKNTSQKLANIMASSQRQQSNMEQKAHELNEYQNLVMQVTSDLHLLEEEWDALDSVPLNTPSSINKHLLETKQFIEKAESLRPVINEINERSHDLDRDASEKSRLFVHDLLAEVNERWKNLVAKTEGKQMALQDLEAYYEDYTTLLCAVDLILDESEAKLPSPVDLDTVGCPQLVAQLDQTQELLELIEVAAPKITALKKCAHQLQKNLPTAEAKVQSQDIVMAMLEKYERIGDRACEQKQLLQEEIDDREGFNTEAQQTVEWLTETKAELAQLAPCMEEPDIIEKIEKIKLSEQEIAIRMEQMRHMAQLHETKFKSQGRDVPKELQDQYSIMAALEQEVNATMAIKEEELLHMKADRQAYNANLKLVTTWLSQAQEQLEDRVADIPEANYRHKELLAEFEPFKKNVDILRTKGSELIKHTSDPVEKQTIQRVLADTNKAWSNVQTKAGEKAKQLKEAEDLARGFSETADAIEKWLEQSEEQIAAQPAWVDVDGVKDQLTSNKKLLKESEQQQKKLGHLNALVKQMEPLCDTVPQMERLADLSHKMFDVRARSQDKVSDLEDVNEQIEEYELELGDIKQWMEKTRAHLTMRDDNLTLKDQLHMQQNLICDIESHKGKALYVLEKHAELHAAIGDESRLHNTSLASEINLLLDQARTDRDELREAVDQQDRYETELRSLSSSITDAQERLLGSPIQASSVDDLKAQITERNELAQQIKIYQARINELSEKSHDLAERSADLGPLCARKLYHTGDRETRVLDLVNTLNAPLEPYVSPLTSPRSPEHSIKYRYQNPLKLFKHGIGPLQASATYGDPEIQFPDDLVPYPAGSSHSSIPSSSPGKFSTTGSERIKPIVDMKNLSSHYLSRTDPSVGLHTASNPDVTRTYPGVKFSTESPHLSIMKKDKDGRTQFDLGVNSSSPASRASARSLSEGRQPLSDTSLPNGESMELSLEIPQMYSLPPKRSHGLDMERKGQPKLKSLKSSMDRDSNHSEIGSVKSGSTEDPRSSTSRLTDFEGDSASLSSHPVTASPSSSNQVFPSEKSGDQRQLMSSGDNADVDSEMNADIPEDLMLLKQRKTEALSPYKPRSKYLASKLGFRGNKDDPDKEQTAQTFESLVNDFNTEPGSESDPCSTGYKDKPWKIKGERPHANKFPIRGEHTVGVNSDLNKSEHEPMYVSEMEGRTTYKPRSPSHLNVPSSAMSHDLSQPSRSAEGDAPSVTIGHRSLSPNAEDATGNDDEDQKSSSPLSKSLTSGLIKAMGSKGIDRLGISNKEAWDPDLSRSSPSLLDPHIQGLRDRSSSFGSRSRLGGSGSLLGSRSASRSSKFDDLSSSWQNLQKQLGTKDRELQVALQKQERYQSTVQDVTARMERVQQKLMNLGTSPFKNLDQQVKEQKEAEQEIECIREDIARVKERGRQIMEFADTEGYQAMQATLAMLTDKIDNLQSMADDKAKILQNATKGKERHTVALGAYKKHVSDMEDWLDEMKVRQAATPLATETVGTLQQQLQENKDLQNELNRRLQHVADLAIRCDNLCELETPETADKLRSQLATLQQNLGNLKLGAIEKQAPLRAAIKESEKRTWEMDDYEKNVKNLQKWITDTKSLTQANFPTEDPSSVAMTSLEKRELQQQLQTDLFQHRNLVHQLSTEMAARDQHRPTKDLTRQHAFTPLSEEAIQPRWEALSKEMTEKRENLEDLIRKTNDIIGPKKYGRRSFATERPPQLNDIRRHLGALNDLWQQLQVQVDDKQLRLEKVLEFQQRYQDALHKVSSWLDLAEHKLFAPDSTMNSEEKVKENEDMQREIRSLQGEINSMGRAAQELLAVTNADSHDLIRQSLGNLNNRVQTLESQARDQGEKLRAVDRNYKSYKDEVENLETKMLETRDMMTSPSPTAPVRLQMDNMQKIEGQMKKCETQLEGVKKRQSELSTLDPEIISPYEMESLQSNFMDLQRKVMEKKATLQESVSVQEQYEKLLYDYADFLETADDKLKTEQISARDLEHLKQQLISHKDFFSDLEVHRAMLDSLVAQCDKATKQKHLPQHTRLSNLTYVLQDKASLHGQRLNRLTRQWAEMEEKFNQLQRFLHDIETQIPKPIANEDTLQTIQHKITTYQRLQRELTEEKPSVFLVVDKGKQLLHSVNCPALEMLVTDVAEKWVDLNTDLSHQLKRSQSLGEQLQVFEAEAAILKSWLTAARSQLNGIKQLSSTDLKSIATVRGKIDKILEFRKEVENQLPLKEKVLSIGKQLHQSQVYQTSDLEVRMRYLEHEWAHLEHDVNNSEEYLHQAQMDLMPSRQALGELNVWLTEIEETLRDERSKPLKNLADMEVLLKKYKSYKIDLSSKQLTVDFVNQEVLQPKDDVDGPPPVERNEFSERLGVLNNRWKDVSKHVSDRLKSLEAIHNKWDEFEKAVTRLISWFHEQEDKMKKYRLIGHEVSVRQTLKDVKALQTTLKSKQIEMQQIKELGEVLVELSEDSPQVRQCIKTSLSNVDELKGKLDASVKQVHQLLDDILAQWDSYHGELQVVSQTLAETEYCLQHYSLIGGDIATLKIQVEKLESLMADMERHVVRFEKFSNLATRLSEVCEPTTRQEIKSTQSDIQRRWHDIFNELRSRTEKFRECLQQWLEYEDEYNSAKTWLDAKEKLCDELLYGKEPRTRRDANLKNCQTLQRELDHFQSQLANLYRVGEDVTKNMDPSSIVNITSKLSALEQRMLTLRQKLSKHVHGLQGDLSQQRRFQEAFDNVKAFVSQAQRILGMEDPNRSADEKVLGDRLEHLKELCAQFNDNSANLDALNDLGYRLALNETAAADLQDLNHKWHELFTETKERCKMLQGLLLVQQDFQSKCDTWMTFLAQTETDLSTEIAGNLIDLLAQQKKCEKFEAETYSRQQILHAIINDGQTMMSEGGLDNKEEFQQKLILLANQWQSVLRRANQRKAIIDSTIKQWQGFNDTSEKLREWLAEKEEVLQVFSFDTASLQKVKNLVEKAKNTQNEFKLQEDLFKNMNTQGKQLVQRADEKAQEEIKVSMAQVQQHWHQIFVKLDGEREKLECVLKRWRECEDDIEEILTWLKDTRKTLAGTLPHAYEELQADMHKCKDIETAFANAEPKRQSLLANEKVLSKTIEPEDLNVLHQRIRLLNKQWDELRNQASLRAQRIDDTMFRWSNFSQKFKELCDWIDRMEVKVISSKDFHIEDLLNRMEKDFKSELTHKEKSKNDLVTQGHALMKISSEVRASDIEQKVTRLEDKWEHLKAVIAFRQRKLQETLLAVQQLDVSMSNLRKWLANMEDDLSAPVVYKECERKEIQRKLQHQNDLQHDIERHSPGVGSVLNLCEVLLHDSDACPTDVEFNGLQTAMKNLERRWRGICQLAPEQRSRLEETWKLWQTLIDDCRVFGDWLKVTESEVTEVTIDQLNVTTSSEEYSRCESVQRKIHENLSKLENINRQYRRLAREGRTDTAGTLKSMMHDANHRWDHMQGQMSANLRELRHCTSIREDFNQTKESLLSWLTEIDMQLTNIEHLSSMDIKTKLREMQRIQEEIDSRARKLDFLDETALFLIQKGDSTDAISTQAEIDSFRQYHRQVLDRVAITTAKLSAMQTEERMHLDGDELDRLERELYALAPGEPLTLDWDMKEIEAYLESSPPESPPGKRRAILKQLRERSRSRSTSPKKLPTVTAATHSSLQASPNFRRRPTDTVDAAPSIRLQRTESASLQTLKSPGSYRPGTASPTRSRSPTRTFRTKSPRRVARDYTDGRAYSPSRQERFNRMKSELTHRGKEAQVEAILEKLADALVLATEKLDTAEQHQRMIMPIGPGVEYRSANYLQSMTEAGKCVEDVRTMHHLLKEETGLHTITSADNQVEAVVSRWEMLQAGAIQKDYRLTQHRKEWHQFRCDLDNMMAWLDEAEALQHSHKPLPGEITKLDSIIRQHKDFLVQLESKKTRVISINLTSRELIDTSSDEGRQLNDRLMLMNKRWDSVCAHATRLQSELQDALMQCQEFHHTVHDLLLWLEGIEFKIQQCEPIKLGNDEAALWTRLRKLRDIRFDLEKNRPRVMSLRDTADQLLLNSDSPEMCQAKDKMHITANRLKALLRLCSSYISSLESRLDLKSPIRSPDRSFDMTGSPASSGASSPRDSGIRTSTPTRPFRPQFRPISGTMTSSRPSTRSPFALSRELLSGLCRILSGIYRLFARRLITADGTTNTSITQHDPDNEDDNDTDTTCCPFLLRVLRTALPLQLLLLLLLAMVCMVPMTEEDYSCTVANNLRRSLHPMLHYTDGPPPV